MYNLATDSLWRITAQVTATFAGFAISALIARSLGPDRFGDYAVIMLIVSTAGFIFNPGIYAAANYFLSAERLHHWTVFILSSCLSLPFSLLSAMLVLYGPAEVLGGTEITIDETSHIMTAVATAVSVFGISMEGIAIGAGRIRLLSRWLAVTSILHATVIATFWFSDSLDLKFSIIIYCSIQVLNAILRTFLALPRDRVILTLSKRETIDFVRHSISVYSGRILSFLSQRLDTYLVFLLAGRTALGYYSLAFNLASQVKLIPTAVGTSMMPNIGALSRESSTQVVKSTAQIMLAIMLIGGASLGVAGALAIPLVYGVAFRSAVIPFLIMLPGIMTVGAYMVVEPYFRALDEPLVPVGISLIAAVGNGALSLLLIPEYGIVGASLAYTFSYFIQLFVVCVTFANSSRLPWFSLLDVRAGFSNGLRLSGSFFKRIYARSAIDV